jgi:hypothetical protein
MFDKWLKLPAHYYLNITALSLLVVGISLSNVLMSIGTIWIIANWLLELDFKAKLTRLKTNKTVIAIGAFFVLMLISLIWSSDLDYALKDLLIKLPFITIPLVIGTSKPLGQKVYVYLLYLFLGTLAFTTLFNYVRFSNNTFGDIRQMSFFISHIRLGVLICLALFLGGYETIKKELLIWFTLPVVVWLLFYLVQSQTLTAYILFSILCLVSLFFYLKRSIFKYILLLFIVIGSVSTSLYVKKHISIIEAPKVINSNNLVWYTASGHSYHHDTTAILQENGNLVWLYVCIEECELEWNKRSLISYDSTDAKGQPIYGTLFRYMSSKGLRKDSVDFQKLTSQDVKNVEIGHVNFIVHSGIKGKINELYLSYLTYKSGGNPNGHSFIQRIEHFKTAIHLIKTNWLFGVGLGDVQMAFELQYELDESTLDLDNRHKSHNQFLTAWISLGLMGFVVLIFILFQPLLDGNINFSVLIVSVSLIFSFFTQDMIETQAGVTIFALFYSIVNYKEKHGSKIR